MLLRRLVAAVAPSAALCVEVLGEPHVSLPAMDAWVRRLRARCLSGSDEGSEAGCADGLRDGDKVGVLDGDDVGVLDGLADGEA